MSCDVGEVTKSLENEQSPVASPTSQLVLQHYFRFSYVTISSLNSPGEPPMASAHVAAAPLAPASTQAPAPVAVVEDLGFTSLSTVSVKSPKYFAKRL